MLSLPAPNRRFISHLLLVVYGTAGALGYGLHILGHQNGLWHEHVNCSHSAVGNYNADQFFVQGEYDYQQSFSGSSNPACVASVTGRQFIASHRQPNSVSNEECSICGFLSQSQSPADAILLANHSVVTPASRSVAKQLESLLVKRDYPPRGPPLCG